jgi:hypothetical protein
MTALKFFARLVEDAAEPRAGATIMYWSALATAALIILGAAFVLGGRYTVAGQGSLVYVVDRFTGAVRACRVNRCEDLPFEPRVAAKEEAATAAGYFDDIIKSKDGGSKRLEPALPAKQGMFDDIPAKPGKTD